MLGSPKRWHCEEPSQAQSDQERPPKRARAVPIDAPDVVDLTQSVALIEEGAVVPINNDGGASWDKGSKGKEKEDESLAEAQDKRDKRDKGKAPADECPAEAQAVAQVAGDKLQITSTVSRTFTCPICFEHVEKGG